MRKLLVLILCLFVLTGCNNTINVNNLDSVFDVFLEDTTHLVNNYSVGYKYYVPSGVRVISSDNYNEKLYYNGYYYYLYVDVSSYYYKSDLEYTVDSSLYFSKKLDYNGISGYAFVEKVDDLYRVEAYYNYAKIETFVDYDSLGQNMINICYILNSIKFNDSVIEVELGTEGDLLKEEIYDFYTPRKEGNFIDYINKYDDYEDTVKDENNIGNEGND